MKSTYFFSCILLFIPMLSYAQIDLERQVVSSSGGYEEDNNISVSWTLGEVAIQTLSDNNADIILTQGFQQPDDITSSVKEAIEEIGMNIFPNPVQQTLNIQLYEIPKQPLSVKLSDANGKILQQKLMDSTNLEIQMGDLPDAMYLLIFSDGERLYTRKVLKATK